MRNIVSILIVLIAGFVIADLVTHRSQQAGTLALACVFFFTAMGHFVKGDAMRAMIPPFIPRPHLVVMLSGIFEVVLAIGLLKTSTVHLAAMAALIFLFLALPLNIYSAFRRVEFGGHGMGPSYLAVRVPLQLLLAWWAYWFGIRPW